jgi:UDP-N-acetylglucosamine kinase
MELEAYSLAEFQSSLKRIKSKLTLFITPSEQPKAYLLGGQSGAGKTTIHRILKEKNPNLIVVDGDAFRAYHPNALEITEKYGVDDVKYTAKFAGQMVESLVNELSNEHYNLVVEGTLRTSEIPLKTAQLLHDRGYDVQFYGMVVKPELSYISTLQRYEMMYKADPTTARATPKSHHDVIIEHLPENLNVLDDSRFFSDLFLVNRAGEILYQKSKDIEMKPSEVVLDVWNGIWTDDEKEMFASSSNIVIELFLKRSNAGAEGLFELTEFIQLVNEKMSQ